MKDPVLIKSNRYGMTLRFDPELPFDLLRERVHEKLHAFTHFFNHACMVVTFEGRTFTKERSCALTPVPSFCVEPKRKRMRPEFISLNSSLRALSLFAS